MTAAPPLPMKVKCVAPWGGGKRTLAPKIVELLGEHTEFHEPFTGGCSILAQKPRCAVERINDLNPKIVNVLKCIRDECDDLAGHLGPIPFSKLSWAFALTWLSEPRMPGGWPGAIG